MPKLFMLLLGATPPERHIEQHDIFFGVGESLQEIIPDIHQFWPARKLHIDAWREITAVDGCRIEVRGKKEAMNNSLKLFFLNLGGYKQNEFEEFHYKMVIVAPDKSEAISKARQTVFYRHTGFEGAHSHIDDKYGVDVDDLYEIADILPASIKEKYSLQVTPQEGIAEDEIHIGYFKLSTPIP